MASSPNVLWAPNPGPQTAFLACPIREILYGGAKGGGKTDAIPAKVLKHVTAYGEHAYALILRESYPQLRELMDRARPLFLLAGATYSKSAKTWTFPGGARVQFGHTSDGYDPYWGQEYSLIVIDEVTRTIPAEPDYHLLLGSLRSSRGVPCSVVLTSNPGGPGHNWVKARFMAAPPLTVQTDERTGLKRVYIPALLSDNPKLPPEYRLQLEQMGEAERKAYLDGDWSAFEGSVFRLERGIHVWTWDQFKERTGHERPPAEWTRFRTLDWGYSSPFAAYWYAVDYDGRAYVYREYYGVQRDSHGGVKANQGIRLEPSKAAEKMARLEHGEKIGGGWAGPDLWANARGDYGVSIAPAEAFDKEGVLFTAWDASRGSRVAAKMALHERLAYKRNDAGDVTEWPGLILIAEETPNAQRTIPALEYDSHDPEDVDDSGEDHSYDSLKAFCLMRPWKPKPKKTDREKAFPRRGERRKDTGTWMSK